MARPALLCGVSHTDVHQVQQRMLDHRVLPYRETIWLMLDLTSLIGMAKPMPSMGTQS